MSFFNKKEDVLEIVLTPHGRNLLSKGKLMPVYYSFLDDDVIYDVGSSTAMVTESSTTTFKSIRSPSTVTHQEAFAEATLVGMPAASVSVGFSVSTWVKLDNTTDLSTRRIYNDYSLGGNSIGLSFSGGSLVFRGISSPGNFCDFEWTITMGDFSDWKHVCISWDGNCSDSNVNLYIDGIDQGLPAATSTASGSPDKYNHAISELRLFDSEVSSPSDLLELQGSLHDFVFWNTKLISNQVEAIYNSGNYKNYASLSFASNLLIWWTLGEESSLSSLESGDSIPNGTVLSPQALNITSGDLTAADNLFIDDNNYTFTTPATFTRLSEDNHEVKGRILENTPSLKPQTNYSDLMVKHTEIEPDLTNDVVKKNIYTIGTSNTLEEYVPSWNVQFKKGELSSSSRNLSVDGKPLNIPQLNIEIEYKMSVENANNIKQRRGILESAERPMSIIYPDGTYLKIDEEQVLAKILEENGFEHSDKLEIEVFKFDDSDQEKLIPLSFIKRDSEFKDDLYNPNNQIAKSNLEDMTPHTVEYYFDVRVDKEIPKDIEEGVVADVYSTNVTDIEDCDT